MLLKFFTSDNMGIKKEDIKLKEALANSFKNKKLDKYLEDISINAFNDYFKLLKDYN